MQEFIIINGLPYLLCGGKAYSVRWDDKGFTVGGVFREGIALTDYPRLSELSVKAKCQGHLDSICAGKPKRGRKAQGDAE